jgi:hypothetical protein
MLIANWNLKPALAIIDDKAAINKKEKYGNYYNTHLNKNKFLQFKLNIIFM